MRNVGQSKKRNQEYEKEFPPSRLFHSLIRSKSPVIIDVGAYHGESYEHYRDIFPDATIYSFEPDPESFAILIDETRKNHHCFNIAIFDSSGSIPFYQNPISHTNSPYKVNTESRDSIRLNVARGPNNSPLYNTEILVEAKTLDQVVAEELINHIDILKIDVQAAEVAVLHGAEKSLHITEVVVIEISFFDYYENNSSFGQIEELLCPTGFSLFSIINTSQNPMNGRTDWVEAVYTKQKVV